MRVSSSCMIRFSMSPYSCSLMLCVLLTDSHSSHFTPCPSYFLTLPVHSIALFLVHILFLYLILFLYHSSGSPSMTIFILFSLHPYVLVSMRMSVCKGMRKYGISSAGKSKKYAYKHRSTDSCDTMSSVFSCFSISKMIGSKRLITSM